MVVKFSLSRPVIGRQTCRALPNPWISSSGGPLPRTVATRPFRRIVRVIWRCPTGRVTCSSTVPAGGQSSDYLGCCNGRVS